jgi:hypothetical protein
LNYNSLAFFFRKNALASFLRLKPNEFPNRPRTFNVLFLHLNPVFYAFSGQAPDRFGPRSNTPEGSSGGRLAALMVVALD